MVPWNDHMIYQCSKHICWIVNCLCLCKKNHGKSSCWSFKFIFATLGTSSCHFGSLQSRKMCSVELGPSGIETSTNGTCSLECFAKPSAFMINQLNNGLLRRHLFCISKFVIPNPPWSFGVQIILHMNSLYFFLY